MVAVRVVAKGWLRSVVRTAAGARKLAALSARSRGTVGSEATSESSLLSFPRRRLGERSSKRVGPVVVANTSVQASAVPVQRARCPFGDAGGLFAVATSTVYAKVVVERALRSYFRGEKMRHT